MVGTGWTPHPKRGERRLRVAWSCRVWPSQERRHWKSEAGWLCLAADAVWGRFGNLALIKSISQSGPRSSMAPRGGYLASCCPRNDPKHAGCVDIASPTSLRVVESGTVRPRACGSRKMTQKVDGGRASLSGFLRLRFAWWTMRLRIHPTIRGEVSLHRK
jgi:hypothetical protein